MRSQFVSKQFKIHNLKFKEVKTLQELTRPNIWKLKPYSSARDEYKGVTASVFLDANEIRTIRLTTVIRTLCSVN